MLTLISNSIVAEFVLEDDVLINHDLLQALFKVSSNRDFLGASIRGCVSMLPSEVAFSVRVQKFHSSLELLLLVYST